MILEKIEWVNLFFLLKRRINMEKTYICNKDYSKCNHLNRKTDDKGYPWGYECMKY